MFRPLLMDLSKAFDCLSHELIIDILNAYAFSSSALKLIHNYLLIRQQRTKINQFYMEIPYFWCTSGFKTSSSFFTIVFSFILFLVATDVNVSRRCYKWFTSLSRKLFQLVFWWKRKYWKYNQMKVNTDKFHLIMSTENAPKLQIGDSLKNY